MTNAQWARVRYGVAMNINIRNVACAFRNLVIFRGVFNIDRSTVEQEHSPLPEDVRGVHDTLDICLDRVPTLRYVDVQIILHPDHVVRRIAPIPHFVCVARVMAYVPQIHRIVLDKNWNDSEATLHEFMSSPQMGLSLFLMQRGPGCLALSASRARHEPRVEHAP